MLYSVRLLVNSGSNTKRFKAFKDYNFFIINTIKKYTNFKMLMTIEAVILRVPLPFRVHEVYVVSEKIREPT